MVISARIINFLRPVIRNLVRGTPHAPPRAPPAPAPPRAPPAPAVAESALVPTAVGAPGAAPQDQDRALVALPRRFNAPDPVPPMAAQPAAAGGAENEGNDDAPPGNDDAPQGNDDAPPGNDDTVIGDGVIGNNPEDNANAVGDDIELVTATSSRLGRAGADEPAPAAAGGGPAPVPPVPPQPAATGEGENWPAILEDENFRFEALVDANGQPLFRPALGVAKKMVLSGLGSVNHMTKPSGQLTQPGRIELWRRYFPEDDMDEFWTFIKHKRDWYMIPNGRTWPEEIARRTKKRKEATAAMKKNIYNSRNT